MSPAFREAQLRSEKKRVLAAILFLSIFEVLMLIRIFVLGSAMSRWGVLVLLSLIAFEIGLLRAVNRVLSSGADISQAVWYLSVTLESLINLRADRARASGAYEVCSESKRIRLYTFCRARKPVNKNSRRLCGAKE